MNPSVRIPWTSVARRMRRHQGETGLIAFASYSVGYMFPAPEEWDTPLITVDDRPVGGVNAVRRGPRWLDLNAGRSRVKVEIKGRNMKLFLTVFQIDAFSYPSDVHVLAFRPVEWGFLYREWQPLFEVYRLMGGDLRYRELLAVQSGISSSS